MFGRKTHQGTYRTKKIIAWVAVIILLISIGLNVVHKLNQPSVGVIKEVTPVELTTQKISSKTLKSDYFSFNYPGRYELQQTKDNSSASLESWILIAHQALGLGQSSKISISIVELSVGGVKEDSAYKHFLAFPELYIVSNSLLSGEPIVISERTNPSFEHTVLWPHGRYLLTISLTSAEKSDELITEVGAILRSFAWL
jgi:hypothetical protein